MTKITKMKKAIEQQEIFLKKVKESFVRDLDPAERNFGENLKIEIKFIISVEKRLNDLVKEFNKLIDHGQ